MKQDGETPTVTRIEIIITQCGQTFDDPLAQRAFTGEVRLTNGSVTRVVNCSSERDVLKHLARALAGDWS